MPITQPRSTIERNGRDILLPVAANAVIYQGALVAVDSADNMAKRGAVSTTLRGVGVAEETVNNTGGAAGAKTVRVKRGVFLMRNSSAGDLIVKGDIGASCFIVDDDQVAKTNGTNTRSVAGVIVDVDADGVWVRF